MNNQSIGGPGPGPNDRFEILNPGRTAHPKQTHVPTKVTHVATITHQYVPAPHTLNPPTGHGVPPSNPPTYIPPAQQDPRVPLPPPFPMPVAPVQHSACVISGRPIPTPGYPTPVYQTQPTHGNSAQAALHPLPTDREPVVHYHSGQQPPVKKKQIDEHLFPLSNKR